MPYIEDSISPKTDVAVSSKNIFLCLVATPGLVVYCAEFRTAPETYSVDQSRFE